jgi:UDP-N-acetylmuramate dehydrogenase
VARVESLELSLLLQQLPRVRGQYRENAALHTTNWFGVGGAAEVLYKPADVQDLSDFLAATPADIPITVIGVGSNLIIRDGGIAGVVIRLGRGFVEVGLEGEIVSAGAAALDVHVARYAADYGRAGLAFLSGIPGTIGGACAMNGGAYGREVKDALIEAELVLRDGRVVRMTADELDFSYRKSQFPTGAIFTRAWFETTEEDPAQLNREMEEINRKRAESQPIRERTGGSTFKNPEGHKAWELIDAAGCRGLRVGGAMMSELHCNFMINTGNATAADLEALGEDVIARVKAYSGVTLEWEIKRIGVTLTPE